MFGLHSKNCFVFSFKWQQCAQIVCSFLIVKNTPVISACCVRTAVNAPLFAFCDNKNKQTKFCRIPIHPWIVGTLSKGICFSEKQRIAERKTLMKSNASQTRVWMESNWGMVSIPVAAAILRQNCCLFFRFFMRRPNDKEKKKQWLFRRLFRSVALINDHPLRGCSIQDQGKESNICKSRFCHPV